MPAEKMLKKRAVLLRADISGPTLERKIRDGAFPAPIKISTRTRRWFEDEIAAWEKALRAERDKRVRYWAQQRELDRENAA